ncbi:MAG: sigma-54-dependent Fis family transcriptional regulator [Saprospiraceae bacterium]|nr:sigma-54-dependent Fis family transcriptional regulator [Saprospiraceae bacterium]
MKTVLLIDDEEKLRGLLGRIIRLEGFEVLEVGDGKSALKRLKQTEVDVVLCDVKLPDANGVELARAIKSEYPLIEIILLTAYGNIPDGVQAIKNGAFDYLTKGDDNNRIIPLLSRAFEKVALSRRVQQLEKQIGEKYNFQNLIGTSRALQAAIDMARRVAATDATVLLLGETGVGKEVFAQAIHQEGNRGNKPFVAVNCSAFSKELLESELFGHKAGAFTGAIKDKKGLFEEAHTGTIFLDEIGEMPMELQARMLRVLETGEFIKVGDTKPTKSDARIIAATNKALQQEAEAGHFRQDLFYRLSVFQIELPPLRERLADIEPLAIHFTQVFAAKTNKKIKGLSGEFLMTLQQHNWPGNIRELKNLIERSVILTDADMLEAESLPYEIRRSAQPAGTGKTLSAFDLASAEKIHIQKVLNYTNGNKTEAARLLNIALTTLYRKIEEFRIGGHQL